MTIPASLTPHHQLVLGLGQPGLGQRSRMQKWSRDYDMGHWHLLQLHQRCKPHFWQCPGCFSSHNQNTTSPSQANALALPIPHHNLALDRWQPESGEKMRPWATFEQSCRHLCRQHMGPLSYTHLYQLYLPLGQRPQCREKEKTPLNGAEPARVWPSGQCSHLGTDPHPCHWAERKSISSVQALALPTPATLPIK